MMSRKILMYESRMISRIRRFLRAEEGVSALEYAILIGVISVGVVAAIVALGEDVTDLVNQAASNVTDATTEITSP